MSNIARKFVVKSVMLALLLGGSACDSGEPGNPGTNNQPLPPEAAAGFQLFNRLGCAVCHSFDNKVIAGPSLRNIYGKEVKLLDGSTLVRDDAYLRSSILEAGKHVVDGYRPTMINYGSMLQDGDIERLLALIRFYSD